MAETIFSDPPRPGRNHDLARSERAGIEPAKWSAGAYGAATLTTDAEDAKNPIAQVTIAAGASLAETNALAERLLTLLNKCV